MQTGTHQLVSISEITLDKANPRIALWLEMYEGEPTPEQINLALGAGVDDKDSQGGTKFSTLKSSILTNGGIIQPVILNTLPDGKKICIEGNTRVCLYKSFLGEKVAGAWERIPAIVYTNLTDAAIEAIRLQAHLVGPRQWDPYSKAKYLTYLRNTERLPFSTLVDFCGGSQKSVMESIDAYADMETYYRPLCASEGDFDPRRFSGFVELQKNNVKTALAHTGFELSHFAKWVFDKKIDPLATVRQLPKILRDQKARQIFLKKGATEAIKALDKPELDIVLQQASIPQLSQALTEAINRILYATFEDLKNNPGSDAYQAILDAQEAVNDFVAKLQAE